MCFRYLFFFLLNSVKKDDINISVQAGHIMRRQSTGRTCGKAHFKPAEKNGLTLVFHCIPG
jgi:hypothetical protein